VLGKLQSQFATKPVSVLFKHGGLTPRFNDDHIVFYGSDGAIYLQGHYGSGQLYHWGFSKQWEALPIPQNIMTSMPEVQGDTELCWHFLAREFVNDIRGEKVNPYPTFKEGSQYQQVIDLIREDAGWTDVAHLN